MGGILMGAILTASALILAAGDTSNLPGAVGPIRYFESLDDGTRILMVDWRQNERDLALIQLDNSSLPFSGSVFAYIKRDATYAAAASATPLAFRSTDSNALHQGTMRKQWLLYGTNEHDRGVRYVELQPPAGTPRAQQIIAAYVEHEGGAPNDELAVKQQIEADIASACGSKPNVSVSGLSKSGLLNKARAAAAGIAELCKSDADARSTLGTLAKLRFERATDVMTLVKRGNETTIGLAVSSLNTSETTARWLKDNM